MLIHIYYIEEKEKNKQFIIFSKISYRKNENISDFYKNVYMILNNSNKEINKDINLYDILYIKYGLYINFSNQIWNKILLKHLLYRDIYDLITASPIKSMNDIIFDITNELIKLDIKELIASFIIENHNSISE